MKTALSLAFVALALVGCDKTIDIKDGRVPPDFLPYVQNFTGSYEGKFDGGVNALELKLEGDRLTVTPRVDLLRESCASRVGALTKLRYSQKNKQPEAITEAEFAFSPGNCFRMAEGDTLFLSGKQSKDGRVVLKASILREIREEIRREPGYQECFSDRSGNVRCHYIPGRTYIERIPFYLNGSFVKK